MRTLIVSMAVAAAALTAGSASAQEHGRDYRGMVAGRTEKRPWPAVKDLRDRRQSAISPGL